MELLEIGSILLSSVMTVSSNDVSKPSILDLEVALCEAVKGVVEDVADTESVVL